jgi:hypothetical protein
MCAGETSAELPPRPSLVHRALPLVALAYLVGLLAVLQFCPDGPIERDEFYHARFANLLPQFGLSREFHWTQASTWKTQFCDKEFLFHVLMVPFARDTRDPLNGVKYFGVILQCAIFVALFVVLRRQRVRLPVTFTLLPLSMGMQFIVRVTMIRSHLLSMLLMIVAIHLLLRKNWKLLFALGFVYAWSYTVPLALVLTAVPFVAARWLGRGGLDWKSPLAALAGVVLGLAIHPYTPYTLETFLTYVQVITIGVGQGAVELGNEIYPWTLSAFANEAPVYGLAFLFLAVLVAWRRKQVSADSRGACGAAVFWFGMSLLFRRFIEYGAPLLAIALALVVRDTATQVLQPGLRMVKIAAAVLLTAVLGGGHIHAVVLTREAQQCGDGPRFRGAAQFLAQNLEPGETVAHLWWDEFTELYYDGYRQNYLWGLDPTYTLRYDAKIATALEEMRLRRRPLDPFWLASTFRARCLVMYRPLARRYPELTSQHWKPAYVDNTAVVFALTGQFGPPADLLQRLQQERAPGEAVPTYGARE